MSDDKKDDDTGRDYILMGQRNPDGSVTCLRHKPDHSVQVGTLVPLRDGVPLNAEGQVVRLTRGEDSGMDVEVMYDGSESTQAEKKGPSTVATKAYRDNYDRIFGTKPTVGSA